MPSFTARARPTCRGAGFTLIELLVVVAIISLLVSILLPSLQRARELARGVVCASSQKQVGLAIQMYMDDNGDCFPPVVVKGNIEPDTDKQTDWWHVIPPYLSEFPAGSIYYPDGVDAIDPIISCPTLSSTVAVALGDAKYRDRRTFGMNFSLGPNNWNYYWRTSGILEMPAETILVSEAGYMVAGYNPQAGPVVSQLDMYWLVQSAMVNGEYVGGVHNGSNNILWCDGHVSAWSDVARLAQQPYAPWRAKQTKWNAFFNPWQP